MLLRRKKIISEEYRIIYTRFVMFLKKLSQTNEKKKLIELKDELRNAKQVADIGWLKEKVDLLIKY